jgi:signal transduction histidine kinase
MQSDFGFTIKSCEQLVGPLEQGLCRTAETEPRFHNQCVQPLSPEIGVSLFRVLQEALQNTIKHSGANRVQAQLREDSKRFTWSSGIRAEVSMSKQHRAARGSGLTSMRERIRLVNGTLAIDSNPNGGRAIQVRVPFGAEASRPPKILIATHAGAVGNLFSAVVGLRSQRESLLRALASEKLRFRRTSSSAIP